MDKQLPIVCSQHQKIVVIDDELAFSGGGLDITIRRWDTPDHRLDDPRRVDLAGQPYAPFHDVQMMVDGDAARALSDIARVRWRRATGEELSLDPQGDDPWPRSVKPDFRHTRVGIARTEPAIDGSPEIREVECLFADSIASATHSIYIENQFVVSADIARWLAHRLKEQPRLEVLIVTPGSYQSWFEAKTMRAGRIRFHQILRDAGVEDRVRMVYPQVRAGDVTGQTMIHSKVMIVDDQILRIGSANLNNRSMGADTECDLVIEATNPTERKAISAIRNRLIADHCGVTEAEVSRAFLQTRSLLKVAEKLRSAEHCLMPIDDGEVAPDELSNVLEQVGDPPRPIAPAAIVSVVIGEKKPIPRSTWIKLAAIVSFIIALTLTWQFTPLAAFANPEYIEDFLSNLSGLTGLALVVSAFIVAGLVVFPVTVLIFPVTVLIAATAAAFGPWTGFAYAVLGSLLSAVIVFGLGAWIGKDTLDQRLGRRMTEIRNRIRRNGVVAVAAIRLVPIAPFTFIKLAAGAGGIRFWDFVGGTMLGMAPGILVMSFMGYQIMEVYRDPTPLGIALFTGAITIWIALSFGVQWLVGRFGRKSA